MKVIINYVKFTKRKVLRKVVNCMEERSEVRKDKKEKKNRQRENFS